MIAPTVHLCCPIKLSTPVPRATICPPCFSIIGRATDWYCFRVSERSGCKIPWTTTSTLIKGTPFNAVVVSVRSCSRLFGHVLGPLTLRSHYGQPFVPEWFLHSFHPSPPVRQTTPIGLVKEPRSSESTRRAPNPFRSRHNRYTMGQG